MITRKILLKIIQMALIVSAWSVPSEAMFCSLKRVSKGLGRHYYSDRIKLSSLEQREQFRTFLKSLPSVQKLEILPEVKIRAVPCGNFAETKVNKGAAILCGWAKAGEIVLASINKKGEAFLVVCHNEDEIGPIITLINQNKGSPEELVELHIAIGDNKSIDWLMHLYEHIGKDLVKLATHSMGSLVVDPDGSVSCYFQGGYNDLITSGSQPLISLLEQLKKYE